MAVQIIRGTLLGVLLGCCVGILFSNAMRLLRSDVVEAFAQDEPGLEGIAVYEDALCAPEDKVVRFHVRANSDSKEDLALKYQVRDAVLSAMADGLKEADSKEKALIYLGQHMQEILEVARQTLREAGYDYEVRAYITRDEFPIREYGSLVLPAGSYQALRIDIGEAKGENFWCLLYPMMCYTIDEGAVLCSEDEQRLCRELSDEEFEKLFVHQNEERAEVKIRFKLLDFLMN